MWEEERESCELNMYTKYFVRRSCNDGGSRSSI